MINSVYRYTNQSHIQLFSLGKKQYKVIVMELIKEERKECSSLRAMIPWENRVCGGPILRSRQLNQTIHVVYI